MLVRTRRRDAVLADVADRIAVRHRGRRLRVAVDGVDGAGKTVFADKLGDRLTAAGSPVVRASVDGFHRPRADRYRMGRDSPEGFYRESFDYGRLADFLLSPLAPDGSGRFRVAAFDHETDAPVIAVEQQAGPGTVLVLDGTFLHRPELCAVWDFSVFLDVGFDVSLPRCAQRGSASPDPRAASNRRYVEGQRL